MKRTSIFLITIVLLTSSCVLAFPINGVVGNGKVATASLPVYGFSAVKNMTSATVRLNRGSIASAKVTIDENLLEELDIHVENGTLIIALRPGKSIYRYAEFTVTAILFSLTEIGIYGSGSIAAADRFVGRSIALNIMGSGDILANSLEAENAMVKVNGSGSVYYYGSPSVSQIDAGATFRGAEGLSWSWASGVVLSR